MEIRIRDGIGVRNWLNCKWKQVLNKRGLCIVIIVVLFFSPYLLRPKLEGKKEELKENIMKENMNIGISVDVKNILTNIDYESLEKIWKEIQERIQR